MTILVDASGLASSLSYKVRFAEGTFNEGSSFNLINDFCAWEKKRPIQVLPHSVLGILAITALNVLVANNHTKHERYEFWVLGEEIGSEVRTGSRGGGVLAKLRSYGVEEYVEPKTNLVFTLK